MARQPNITQGKYMNTMRRLAPVLLLLAGMSATAWGASAAGALSNAVAHPARPEADRARDADRKPAELLELTGLHAGNKVAEIMPGGGYFTRIFSKLVGPEGKVYAWVPFPPPDAPAGARDMRVPMQALASDAEYRNIALANLDPAVALPEPVDLVWTSLNYHDFHNRADADLVAFGRMAFNALKPGGLYMVIDHAAQNGSGTRDTRTLHRVDPELVRREVTAAGFTLVMQSDVLSHPADDRTRPAHEVTRGQTDQFVLLFQRPHE